MRNVKVVAMYLPQYHEIEENNLFWGKGFTDWVSVKEAKPLFHGHIQPKQPEGGRYYDLSVKQEIAKQVKLAKEYGVYGFGMYHYWFSSEKHILDTPTEIILNSKDLDINFLLAWDNSPWVRSWSAISGNTWSPKYDKNKSNDNQGVMIELKYGDETDWKIHYDYLRRYFIDDRYIKINGKPVFVIFNSEKRVQEMCEYMNKCAVRDGFKGIFFIDRKRKGRVDTLENEFLYEPLESGWLNQPKLLRKIQRVYDVIFHNGISVYNYDSVWKHLLKNAKRNTCDNVYFGCFVNYDDSPRRGKAGRMIKGATPEKFSKYMSELLSICQEQSKEFVFLTAWNEWGEGAYLEPDTLNSKSFLEALNKSVHGN